MADFDIDNPVFEPDDWEENIGDDDVLSTLLHDDDGASPSERVTIDGTSTSVTLSLQQELLQTAVDDYYNAAAEAGLTPSLGRDPGKFELVDGQIRLKAYPNLDLVNKRSGRPLALSTLASRGGTKAIREDLGFADWAAKKSSLPAQAVEALQTTNLELGEAAAAVDSVELEDLGQTVTEVSDAIQRMETALTDTQIDEVLGTLDDPPLTLREIRGLDKALQTIRGELTNNLAKLTEHDDHIALEKRKLDEADAGGVDELIRRRIAERLRDLQDERSARLEAASASKDALRSQISRMRETIGRVLNEDTTLAERVRTLFREQGVTLVSILTAVGYQYARPCVNRRRRHCNPTIPTTSPIGQRRSSRVGQKNAPSSWPCLGQTGWQGGCGATGDHWEHLLLAPQHLGEGRRMARRARVGSGGSRWRPALPGCPRTPSAS